MYAGICSAINNVGANALLWITFILKSWVLILQNKKRQGKEIDKNTDTAGVITEFIYCTDDIICDECCYTKDK